MVWNWNGSAPKFDAIKLRRLRRWIFGVGIVFIPSYAIALSIMGAPMNVFSGVAALCIAGVIWLHLQNLTDLLVFGKPWPVQDPFVDKRVFNGRESARHMRGWLGKWVWVLIAYLISTAAVISVVYSDTLGLVLGILVVVAMLVPLLLVIVRGRGSLEPEADEDR